MYKIIGFVVNLKSKEVNKLPETDYLKVPADRVGALIGTKGETKQILLVYGKQIIL